MGYIFDILLLVLAITALVMLLSFAFSWYESANYDHQLMEGRFQPRRLWLAFKVFSVETLIVFLSFFIRPLGWIFRYEPIHFNQEDTPIILLHGLFHDRSCWLWTKYRLRREGFYNLHTVSLPPWHNVENLTERIAKKVDKLRLSTGIKKVHLIGHSMGGLLARNYIQVRGGNTKVDSCILLGTPNLGSRLAPFALSPLAKLLLPGSDFLERLAQTPMPAEIPVTSIFSRHDNLVQPFFHARLEGVHNVELSGMGHTSLLYNSRAFAEIIKSLRGLQHENDNDPNPFPS
ncbi:MAG: alpha/beta fold hydrolase [Deltaproteobacteria bacterium]|nr:alpha/beta fold hydrolase [Deltaproteobacteria bacterium]